MNTGKVRLVIAGGEDAWAGDVSTRLAAALGQSLAVDAGECDVDWSTQAGDGGSEPFVVEVASLRSHPDGRERRMRLLGAADVVVFVAPATPGGWPLATAGLAALRSDLADRACPFVVFGVRPVAEGGIEADELRRHLDIPESALVLTGAASDRTRLRQVFAFAVRSAFRTTREAEPMTAAPASVPPAPLAAPAPSDAPSEQMAVPPDPFAQDGIVVEAVLNIGRIESADVDGSDGATDGRGVGVSLSAAEWAALAELVGELAVVRGTGNERREAQMRSLLAAGVLAPCPVAADGSANVWGRSLAPTASSAEPTPEPAMAAPDTRPAAQSGDRYRALKELRRQLLG